jgi:hypothetical protein
MLRSASESRWNYCRANIAGIVELGSWRGRGSPLHLVSAWASRQRLVLDQEAVDKKSNEIVAIPLLLERLELKGAPHAPPLRRPDSHGDPRQPQEVVPGFTVAGLDRHAAEDRSEVTGQQGDVRVWRKIAGLHALVQAVF